MEMSPLLPLRRPEAVEWGYGVFLQAAADWEAEAEGSSVLTPV